MCRAHCIGFRLFGSERIMSTDTGSTPRGLRAWWMPGPRGGGGFITLILRGRLIYQLAEDNSGEECGRNQQVRWNGTRFAGPKDGADAVNPGFF